jgi:hypothetical protein
MKLTIFFHVCFMDARSKEIVDEILTVIEQSWLLGEVDQLHIWVINGKIITNNPKIIIHNFWANKSQFEFPTLKLLSGYCLENPEDKVLYLHTKWATAPCDENKRKWRKDMLDCVVKNYKLCIDKLNEYETVWTKLLMENSWYPRHYSWNFWWARASYINTLWWFEWKEHDRFYAERWLMSNKNILFLNIT